MKQHNIRTQLDNAKDPVMPIFDVKNYSGSYSKTYGSLFQFYRD